MIQLDRPYCGWYEPTSMAKLYVSSFSRENSDLAAHLFPSPVRPALDQRSLGLLRLHSEVGLNQVVGSQATQHRELVRLEVSEPSPRKLPMMGRASCPLVNRLLWKFNRQLSTNGPFSIARLDYQRVIA